MLVLSVVMVVGDGCGYGCGRFFVGNVGVGD